MAKRLNVLKTIKIGQEVFVDPEHNDHIKVEFPKEEHVSDKKNNKKNKIVKRPPGSRNGRR